MRFYRIVFWIAAAWHLAASLAFVFAPDLIVLSLSYPETMPWFALQTQGMFYLVLACAFGFVAERPSKSVAIVSLALLAKSLLPLIILVAFLRQEIGMRPLIYQGISSGLWLPVLISYLVWFYHVPRPTRFLAYMGLFGKQRRSMQE